MFMVSVFYRAFNIMRKTSNAILQSSSFTYTEDKTPSTTCGSANLTMPNKTQTKCRYGPTNSYTVATLLGDYVIVSCPKGLHSLGMVDGISDANFKPNLKVEVSLLSQLYQDNGYAYKPAMQCITWLQAYFSCHGREKKLPALPDVCTHIGKEGTFTHKVWFTLLKRVPFGNTVSYKALAKLCDNEKACRAVGQAMSHNPVGLVIPCHRVVQEGGSLGNYHGGTRNKVKEWLLRHEGVLK